MRHEEEEPLPKEARVSIGFTPPPAPASSKESLQHTVYCMEMKKANLKNDATGVLAANRDVKEDLGVLARGAGGGVRLTHVALSASHWGGTA